MEKEKLIDSLIKDGYLETPIIIEAFKKIDRKDFVGHDMKSVAYSNQALPIGKGQTISQPLTVAFLLEKLQPQTGDKILDIGTGSGWQAALLAYIISNNDKEGEGKVVTVERIKSLKEEAEANIKKYNFIEKGVVDIVLGDGSKGYKEEAPYDKIISAAASEKLPKAWKDQVVQGGNIVAPIGHSIYSYQKISDEDFVKDQHFGFSFVPLVEGSEKY